MPDDGLKPEPAKMSGSDKVYGADTIDAALVTTVTSWLEPVVSSDRRRCSHGRRHIAPSSRNSDGMTVMPKLAETLKTGHSFHGNSPKLRIFASPRLLLTAAWTRICFINRRPASVTCGVRLWNKAG
jgi:hypothetical protein